jgi:class 3 adenylate cyclase
VVATREVRKVVTVLFCDLTGSTAMGERTDPEALRALMNRYYETARVVLERHGGTVEKFVGDAVMAVFGIPVASEDDALRATRAAVELRDVVQELGLDARIGVNTGAVVAGEGDTLVTGDAVNVAARLEQAAGAGEILLGEDTLRLVRDAVTTEPLELTLKGKSGTVPAYRLERLDVGAVGVARRLERPWWDASASVRGSGRTSTTSSRRAAAACSRSSAPPESVSRAAWRTSSRTSSASRPWQLGVRSPTGRGSRTGRWWRCSCSSGSSRRKRSGPRRPRRSSRQGPSSRIGHASSRSCS